MQSGSIAMLGKPQRGYRLVGLVVRGPPSPVSTGPQNVYTSAYLLAYMRPDCAIDAAAVHLSTKVDTNQASAGRKAGTSNWSRLAETVRRGVLQLYEHD